MENISAVIIVSLCIWFFVLNLIGGLILLENCIRRGIPTIKPMLGYYFNGTNISLVIWLTTLYLSINIIIRGEVGVIALLFTLAALALSIFMLFTHSMAALGVIKHVREERMYDDKN